VQRASKKSRFQKLKGGRIKTYKGLRIRIKSLVFAITPASSIKLPARKILERLLVEKMPPAGDRKILNTKH